MVVQWARERDLAKVYGTTQATNATARRRYDTMAGFLGLIRYDLKLWSRPQRRRSKR